MTVGEDKIPISLSYNVYLPLEEGQQNASDFTYLIQSNSTVPDFRETVSEIRLTARSNFVPEFVPFLILRFYSVFLIIFFRIENLLYILSEFVDEEMATMVRMEQ
jgi:hypothetical protein